MRRAACIAGFIGALVWLVPPAAAAPSDPYCTGSYGGAPPQAGSPLRFGIDVGLAGSAGGAQIPAPPDDPAKDVAALQALDPPGRVMVARLNRLFWSAGRRGIKHFKSLVRMYTHAGFEVELQVRYHPPPGEAGDIPAWITYVRHVVDTFGANPGVVDMTITNEVNVTFSPNTSDGYYAGAEQALITGIEAAHAEALARHFDQFRFGFTYAYRFSPQGDASFFSYLGQHGGPAFLAALGYVGVDFYPGTIYPPVMGPTDSYRAELAQAAGVVRSCYLPQAQIPPSVPIWFTENGVPSAGPCAPPLETAGCGVSEDQQASTLAQLVTAACDYAGTYGITDYRWFNLRDSSSSGPQTLIGPTFAAFGLLRDDYSAKPAFAVFRSQVASCGAHAANLSIRGPHHKRRRGRAGHRRRPSRRRFRARQAPFTG